MRQKNQEGEMKDYQQFEKAAQHLIEKYKVPGSIVAIAHHGKIIYEKPFGYRNMEESKRVTRDTVFGLASITKSFTCVAIMQLAEQGKLDIYSPVITYLPNFKIKNLGYLKEITIFHFMTHSSGLPPLPSLDLAMFRERNDESMIDFIDQHEETLLNTYDDLINFISNVALFSKPGKLFSYSNDAYALLGAIIENVSGMTYEQYVLENVIKRCGLKDTFFHIDDDKTYNNITTCYEQHEEDGTIYAVQDWWDAPSMRATGFLKSTASDMLTFSTLFINKGIVNNTRILSEESVKQMLQAHIKMDPEKYYGFGFAITPNYFGKKLVDHGGSLQSISSKFAIIPEEGISIIVLTNLSGFPASKIMELALNTYFGRDLDAHHLSHEEYKVAPNKLALYEGEYQSGEGMDIVINVKNDKITFSYKGEYYPTKFICDNVFYAYMDDVFEPIEIVIDNAGNAIAISIFHRIVPKVN